MMMMMMIIIIIIIIIIINRSATFFLTCHRKSLFLVFILIHTHFRNMWPTSSNYYNICWKYKENWRILTSNNVFQRNPSIAPIWDTRVLQAHSEITMWLCIHVTWRRGLPSSGTWLKVTPQKNRILNYIAVELQGKGWYRSTGRIIKPNHPSLLISIYNTVLSYQQLILGTSRWTVGSTWWPTKLWRLFALFCSAVSPSLYRQPLRCLFCILFLFYKFFASLLD